MIYYDIEQGTEDWFNMRVGSCTSSRLNDALAKLKDPKSESAARRNYKRELAIERLTLKTFEHYLSEPMKFGIENEPLARTEYEIYSGNEVLPIGLAMHPTIKWFMASTDGLVGSDGMIEIKCPNTLNHLDILISGEIPEQYHKQMLGGMACAEREWCDFVSFDPRMPEDLRMFVKRFYRDDKLIAGMQLEIEQFLSEVEVLLTQLKETRSRVLADYAMAIA